MSEFCLKCMNEQKLLTDSILTEGDVVTCKSFCEDCKEIKPCVIRLRKRAYKRLLKEIQARKAEKPQE